MRANDLAPKRTGLGVAIPSVLAMAGCHTHRDSDCGHRVDELRRFLASVDLWVPTGLAPTTLEAAHLVTRTDLPPARRLDSAFVVRITAGELIVGQQRSSL